MSMAGATACDSSELVLTAGGTDSVSDLSDHLSELGAASYIKSDSTQSLNEEVQYSVLDPDQLVDYMKENITDISSIIDEDFTVTRLLLAHFKWDRQSLLERLYERDKTALFREAKVVVSATTLEEIPNPFVFSDALQQLPGASSSPGDNHEQTTLSKARSKQAQLEQPQIAECGICLTPAESSDEGFQLACSHRFCRDCWRHYLTHSILDEGIASNITCPAYQCRMLVRDSTVLELINNSEVRLRYQHLITNSFVSCNKKLRWCPAAGCNKVVKADELVRQVTCSCGEKFCFQCGDRWHNPIRCDWMKGWTLKCSLDSSTTSWIASNTKECPKCSATIEKDGGCNHIVCRNDNCMYEFCWVCLGSWQDHGQNAWYHCNRYNERSSKDARTAMEKSRASMLRFLHYYNRYANHQQSMKFEADLYTKVNTRMREMREGQGQVWNEVKFLKAACDVLCRARHLLMITYVFAYFVTQNNQSIIFEDNQRDLELATEHLSEYLERDTLKNVTENMKQKVNDKSNYCARRCAVLISHINEGYESGWWEISSERRNTV